MHPAPRRDPSLLHGTPTADVALDEDLGLHVDVLVLSV